MSCPIPTGQLARFSWTRCPLGVDENTKEKGIPNPVPESMTNQELAVLLFPREERRAIASSYMVPDFARLAEELKKPHVTKKLLWKEYISLYLNRLLL